MGLGKRRREDDCEGGTVFHNENKVLNQGREVHVHQQHIYTNGNDCEDRRDFGSGLGTEISQYQLRKSLLLSLSFPQMFARRDNIERPHEDTCRWVLRHSEHEKWRQDRGGVLWIKGKPGAGKSTLMSFLNDRYCRGSESKSSVKMITFFFHARGSELQRTPIGMFRSLVYQLLQCLKPSQLSSINVQDYNISERGEDISWGLVELRNLFEEVLLSSSKNKRLILLIDALDEAGHEDANTLGNFFYDLDKKILKSGVYAKIVISCRHYPAVTRSTRGICVEECNADDIRLFVEQSLGDLGSGLDEIIDTIVSKSHGLFQWARLVVSTVARLIGEGESRSEIISQLEKTPGNLEDIYGHIITNSIQPRYRKRSYILFQWLCYSFKTLSVLQMREALNQASGNSISDDEQMGKLVVTLSGGLAEVVLRSVWAKRWPRRSYRAVHYRVYRKTVHGDDSVQLIHQTAREFLLGGGLQTLADMCRSPSDMDMSSRAHRMLFETCIDYMDKLASSEPSGKKLIDLSNDCTLYKYSNDFAIIHAADTEGHFIEIVQGSHAKLERAAQVFGLFSEDSGILITGTPLHLAVYFNSRQLVLELLSNGANIDIRNTRGYTPLHFAIACKHESMVDTLISAGAEVQATENSGMQSLALATKYGATQIAKTLMLRDACSFGEKNAALGVAISYKQDLIARMLQTAGADINRAFKDSIDTLQEAAYSGDRDRVRLMLDLGTNVAAAGNYSSALNAAAVGDNWDIVDMLLSEWDSELAPHRNSALREASDCGHFDVAKLLVQAGADVNTIGGEFGSPLHAAAWHGDSEMAEYLLDEGADPYHHGGLIAPMELAFQKKNDQVVAVICKAIAKESENAADVDFDEYWDDAQMFDDYWDYWNDMHDQEPDPADFYDMVTDPEP